MRIHRENRLQVPIEKFARDTYRAFSETNIGELSRNKPLKKTVIEGVEIRSSLRDGKLVVKSLPMFFSYSNKPKEAEIFRALPKNQASRLLFKDREALVEDIEIGAEYTMALTETDSFAYYKASRNNSSPLIKIKSL